MRSGAYRFRARACTRAVASKRLRVTDTAPARPRPRAAPAPAPTLAAKHSLRAPVTGENFYFVMADRFENGDTANDHGGLARRPRW